MSKYDSSLQSQNPISQAQNAVKTAHNAVSQAMSHPSGQSVYQAEQSLQHAERAVQQAADSDNPHPVQLAEEMLAAEQSRLNSIGADQLDSFEG